MTRHPARTLPRCLALLAALTLFALVMVAIFADEVPLGLLMVVGLMVLGAAMVLKGKR